MEEKLMKEIPWASSEGRKEEAFFSASEEAGPLPSSPKDPTPSTLKTTGLDEGMLEKVKVLLAELGHSVSYIAGGEFKVGHFLASGTFSKVYAGVRAATGSRVAIKFEKISTRHPQLLMHEARLCKKLERSASGIRLPNVHWYGVVGKHNAMVMDMLGPSLQELFDFSNRSFSVKTICDLATQVLDQIECLHAQNVVHRDIQPNNLLVGTEEMCNQVHLIDMGIAKKFKSGRTHIPYREMKAVLGHNPFASLNALKSVEQSRRDDLESLGYIMVYFQIGWLPWLPPPQKPPESTPETAQQATERTTPEATPEATYKAWQQVMPASVLERRCSLSLEALCQYGPPEFTSWLRYCMGLRFQERPNYSYLRELLKDAATKKQPREESLSRHKYSYDFVPDWRISPTPWSRPKEAKRHKDSQSRKSLKTSQ